MATGDEATRNELVARRWVDEVLNRRNPAAVDELLAPDFEEHPLFHTPFRPSWVRGGSTFERIKQTIDKSLFGLENRLTTVDQTIAAGDKVVTVMTTTSTRKGKQVSYSEIVIARFADGKIAEGWYTFDRLGVYQQLGVIAETPELMRQAGLET